MEVIIVIIIVVFLIAHGFPNKRLKRNPTKFVEEYIPRDKINLYQIYFYKAITKYEELEKLKLKDYSKKSIKVKKEKFEDLRRILSEGWELGSVHPVIIYSFMTQYLDARHNWTEVSYKESWIPYVLNNREKLKLHPPITSILFEMIPYSLSIYKNYQGYKSYIDNLARNKEDLKRIFSNENFKDMMAYYSKN